MRGSEAEKRKWREWERNGEGRESEEDDVLGGGGRRCRERESVEVRVMSYDDEDKYEWYLINKWIDKSDLMRRDKGGEVDIFHKVGSVIRRR